MTAVAGTITVIPPTGNGVQNVVTPTQPAGMMQNMTVANSKCSAVVTGLGDTGATATTTNINCFLSTGRLPRILLVMQLKLFIFHAVSIR